jgi:predicted RNA binding protein YcfA (HicA-like mRNA interferase family)
MAKRIRELKAALARAGFTCRRGKGSHTKWSHPRFPRPIVLSGNDGSDAKPYQEAEVARALRQVEEQS